MPFATQFAGPFNSHNHLLSDSWGAKFRANRVSEPDILVKFYSGTRLFDRVNFWQDRTWLRKTDFALLPSA